MRGKRGAVGRAVAAGETHEDVGHAEVDIRCDRILPIVLPHDLVGVEHAWPQGGTVSLYFKGAGGMVGRQRVRLGRTMGRT